MQGVSAVVGTISRNLADLQDNKGNFTSIYDHPGLPFQVLSCPFKFYPIQVTLSHYLIVVGTAGCKFLLLIYFSYIIYKLFFSVIMSYEQIDR